MNAFHVLGGLFALWALLLAGLGITREDFPGEGRQLLIGGISVVLALGAISSAIITSALEEEDEGEAAERAGEAPAPAGGRELALAADPGGGLAFDRRTLRAEAGRVTLVMENPSQLPHNVSLEGSGVDEEGETVGNGGTSRVSANVEPGRYVFYCSVAGHREGGMEGRLTVR